MSYKDSNPKITQTLKCRIRAIRSMILDFRLREGLNFCVEKQRKVYAKCMIFCKMRTRFAVFEHFSCSFFKPDAQKVGLSPLPGRVMRKVRAAVDCA